MALKVYFAAPLFDDMELERNARECAKLEKAGMEVFLPQRDAGEAAHGASPYSLFAGDIAALREADVVIAYIDGRVPDEGTCFELGYAFATLKRIFMVRTDARSFINGNLNVMIQQCGRIVKSTEEVIECLEE